MASERLEGAWSGGRFRVLLSRPNRSLREGFLKLTEQASEAWMATAFLNWDMLEEIMKRREAGCMFRILTGTFGRQTRQQTFKRLLELRRGGSVRARIWDCGQHRDFHAKLYLWRVGEEGVAWVGSANLTAGLWREGELVLEVRGKWEDALLRALRTAFEAEWKRARPLDESFVRAYRESRRIYSEVKARPPRGRDGGPRRPAGRGSSSREIAFLFTWNPRNHPTMNESRWKKLVKKFMRKRHGELEWSCGNRKDPQKIPRGAMAFIIRLGVPDKGIVAIGRTTGKAWFDEDWRPKAPYASHAPDRRREVLYAELRLEELWERPVVTLDELRDKWPRINWSPHTSGIAIPAGVARKLWKLCKRRATSSSKGGL
ncbi:phospholipase D-like domain-containing protein [Thermoflexus sp.]|uniref:phospholipase D-like domain-containing protein n=1 Tax=Thermoflexus sp. TaxID=1969742 RepID=UPI0035E42696